VRASYHGIIKSYPQAAEYLATGKNKADRPLPGRETRLQRRSDTSIAVRYWQTDIVTYHEDGTIVLDSGGYHTFTTKAKINEYLPREYGLNQDKNIWYVHNGVTTALFKNGMSFAPDGTMTGTLPESDIKKQAKLNRAIAKYARDFIDAWLDSTVPAPSSGDCWFCSMHTTEGQALGEVSQSDHILSHMKEKYYVPSLLVNALKKYDWSSASQWALGEAWGGATTEHKTYWMETMAPRFVKALRRYIRSQLDLASSQ